jgi:hypothetical protein
MSKVNVTVASKPTFSNRGDRISVRDSQPKPLIVGFIFMTLFVAAIIFITL